MSTPIPESVLPVTEIAAALLASPDVTARARIIVERISELLLGSACVVYVVDDPQNPLWTPKAWAGDLTAGNCEYESGTLGGLVSVSEMQVFESVSLQRELYAHLDIRRAFTSLVCIPLLSNAGLTGAIEVVGFDEPFAANALQVLSELAELASVAIAAAVQYESERNVGLQSISRVTQMYDLEKVLNATLEIGPLLDLIAKKFKEVLGVQAVNLWMVSGDGYELAAQSGFDATASIGDVEREADSVAALVGEEGETILIDDPEDPRLESRNAGYDDSAVFSLVAAALMESENLVGVAEAVNRLDGQPFDEDDQFMLMNMCATANNALHNAELLQAERKLEILEALVKVSGTITSTLDLDRVLQSIVNDPATVIHYERAAIALEERGKLQIRAVTGAIRINPQDPEIIRLQDLLEWASLSGSTLLVTQHEDRVDSDREETRKKFEVYFAESGMRAFYAIPLSDDDGRVGMLAFESREPDFLGPAHLEMVSILAGQATVALRNASLYREVPFIDLLEPLLARKRKFLALEKRRRMLLVATAVLVLIFLAAVPLPLRVDGPALVTPARTAKLQSDVGGIIRRVNVREGDTVAQGDALAQLDDLQYREELAASQAKYAAAIAEMNRALSQNDGSAAGVQRAQAEYWRAEVDRNRERLAHTVLRSPIAGKVATSHIEDRAGQLLNAGDTFAEVVNTRQAGVDVSLDEVDLDRLKAGQPAALKLEGLPSRTFHTTVEVVSPNAALQGNQRLFFARLVVPNEDGVIRSGMQGRSKISTGWAPAGWVLFRRPALWLWSKVWSLFGW